MPDELFELDDRSFSFISHGVTLNCERLNIPGSVAFRVTFSSRREPIVVVKARGMNQPYFWTSIPEGRQREAEAVGKMIEDYLQNKQ